MATTKKAKKVSKAKVANNTKPATPAKPDLLIPSGNMANIAFDPNLRDIFYLTYSDQYPTRESGDKVACLDKVLLSFVGLQCGSML